MDVKITLGPAVVVPPGLLPVTVGVAPIEGRQKVTRIPGKALFRRQWFRMFGGEMTEREYECWKGRTERKIARAKRHRRQRTRG